jgi:hypothetical protein
MHLWKVPSVFFRPNGVDTLQKELKGVMKEVACRLETCMAIEWYPEYASRK